MKRFLIAIVLWLGLAAPVLAQTAAATSTSGLTNLINTQFPNNTTGAITPQNLRQVTLDMMASSMLGCVNAQSSTSYTIQTSDYGCLITFNNANPVAVTLPQGIYNSGLNSFFPFNTFVTNNGGGAVTITPQNSTIGGASTFQLTKGQGVWIVSDGANYQVFTGGAGGTTGTCSLEAAGAQLGCINLSHAYVWTNTQTFAAPTSIFGGVACGSTGICLYTPQQSSTNSFVLNSTTPPNGQLQVVPNMGVGNNNALVQAGDSAIIFSDIAQDTGNFVLAPWASCVGGCGLRMDSAGNTTITKLTATQALATAITITQGAVTTSLTATQANVANLTATNASVMSATITNLTSTYADLTTVTLPVWSSFTPTVHCGASTMSTTYAHFERLGHTTIWAVDTSITPTLGANCASAAILTLTLPSTLTGPAWGAGLDLTSDSRINCAQVTATVMTCVGSTNLFTTGSRIIFGGSYENN